MMPMVSSVELSCSRRRLELETPRMMPMNQQNASTTEFTVPTSDGTGGTSGPRCANISHATITPVAAPMVASRQSVSW
jgi:hypothetical protein